MGDLLVAMALPAFFAASALYVRFADRLITAEGEPPR
jgi:hypothetical protein